MKVVELRKAADAETVDLCRELLRMAEAGEIVSAMMICETPDGGRLSRYTACRDTFAILADAARLTHRIQRRLDEATAT